MSITYIIRLRVFPEHRAPFLKLLNGVLDTMSHEPAFVSAVLNDDPSDINHFLFQET